MKANDLKVNDIIQIEDIIYQVVSFSTLSIDLKNINPKDERVARLITSTTYYRTEPDKRWQQKLDEIGFQYLGHVKTM